MKEIEKIVNAMDKEMFLKFVGLVDGVLSSVEKKAWNCDNGALTGHCNKITLELLDLVDLVNSQSDSELPFD